MITANRTALAALLFPALSLTLAGCPRTKERSSAGSTPTPTAQTAVTFEPLPRESGLVFRHYSGAKGKKYMPETVGSGCAVLDYDGDGRFDVFFVNSTDWPGPGSRPHGPALYRNLGQGRFEDVTTRAGLTMDVYGMGAAVGDYDNDGDPDLFITCVGPNRLYRNEGGVRFKDVTQETGLAGRPVEPGGLRWKWSASAAWLDYDRDGLLDLFVENYVKWTPATDPWCGESGRKSYCPPTNFEGVPSLLYRNLGTGRFREVSDSTGIGRYAGKSFGVAVADYNEDGWPDIAVANDTMENYLFINEGGKRFSERGMESGIALSPAGAERAGMGIDAADWTNSGHFGLVIGNFSREALSLYKNDGQANFEEVSYTARIAEPSLLSLTFGLFFFDSNLDGFQDVFAANGHIDDFVHMKDAMISYEQAPLLLQGSREGTFQDVTGRSGTAFARKRVLRGCARGDLDNDGDPDIVTVWNNGQGEIWLNSGRPQAGWIGLWLQGKDSPRDGNGSLVRLVAPGLTQTSGRRSGSSFLSEHDPRLLFGLGTHQGSVEARVVWPRGKEQVFANLRPGAYYRLVEGAAEAQPISMP